MFHLSAIERFIPFINCKMSSNDQKSETKFVTFDRLHRNREVRD